MAERAARKRKKGGPAAGHRSDPDWRPSEDDDGFSDDVEPAGKDIVVKAASAVPEQGYLDVDIVEEDSGALPVGETKADEDTEPEPEADTETAAADDEAAVAVDDGTADEYETVEDTSGLEPSEEPPTAQFHAEKHMPSCTLTRFF